MNDITGWILVAAGCTLALRSLGIWSAGWLKRHPLAVRVMDQLPAPVMVAIVLPEVVQAGWAGGLAATLVILAAFWTHNLLLSITVGVASLALLRMAVFT